MDTKHQLKKNSLIVIISLMMIFFGCTKNEKEGDRRYANRLIKETSPYLLQHAYNPVDWRPWSPKEFEEAKTSNKLVLVSVGYSTCHWCHVMEEETFTNDSVAELMNQNFINIKVDREERPDVDQVYMTALQLMRGSGGWPLNVVTLPNGKPIYSGTYHTKKEWIEVLKKIIRLHKDDPEKLYKYADQVTAGVQEINNFIEPTKKDKPLTRDLLKKSVRNGMTDWDNQWGGNKEDKKFVIPSGIGFLLDYAILENDHKTLKHVEKTLDKMALGGLYDHVRGGFFRYSTDRFWKVPHFEKMLYTNAQLVSLYAKAYKFFKKPLYKEVTVKTIDFLIKEMKSPEGGFYTAIDADSDGEEGKYYLWGELELKEKLKNDFRLFSEYYNLKEENIIHSKQYHLLRSVSDSLFASNHNLSLEDFKKQKGKWEEIILELQKDRTRPKLDNKIIVSLNSLLIKGLTDAYQSFKDETFLNEAIEIFEFLKKNCLKDGYLMHSYDKGNNKIRGFLDDYAFLMEASIELFSVTLEARYIDFALDLYTNVDAFFQDTSSEMFVYNIDEQLISNIVKVDDGVLPSPNSVIAHNLFRISLVNHDKELLLKSRNMLSLMLPKLNENANGFTNWNRLLLHNTYPFYEIAVVGDNAENILGELQSHYVPNVYIVGTGNESTIPIFQNRYLKGETFIYVCQEGLCKLPVKKVEDAIDLL
ncbi:thioredoxin domain-containing protein [uncultured Aquimarina sp.]|uniref:thioredoxin domain-containing protein n=1 Tax=uncultured Aquimarina sp. TaxID=575652 RepID=UPI002614CD9D|nr:thioredoxin domain-containing protein [uncultured Aquimarina sp.]